MSLFQTQDRLGLGSVCVAYLVRDGVARPMSVAKPFTVKEPRTNTTTQPSSKPAQKNEHPDPSTPDPGHEASTPTITYLRHNNRATSEATPMKWSFLSPCLSAASKVVISTLLCISYGANANPTVFGGNNNVAPPPRSLGASEAGEAAVPPEAGWKSITMTLNDGAIKKTVMIRDDADEKEVIYSVFR